MTSRERILAVLRGGKPDRVPIFPKIAFSNVLACPGMTVREYMTNPGSMAEAAIRARARAFTHICGRIEPTADLIAQTGTDVVDFDHLCDYETLLRLAPGKVFRGNIDSELFVFGKESEIRESVRKLLSKASSSGKLLLGSGCEIALNTPVENLHAFVEAGREFGIQDNFP